MDLNFLTNLSFQGFTLLVSVLANLASILVLFITMRDRSRKLYPLTISKSKLVTYSDNKFLSLQLLLINKDYDPIEIKRVRLLKPKKYMCDLNPDGKPLLDLTSTQEVDIFNLSSSLPTLIHGSSQNVLSFTSKLDSTPDILKKISNELDTIEIDTNRGKISIKTGKLEKVNTLSGYSNGVETIEDTCWLKYKWKVSIAKLKYTLKNKSPN
jgi:hypothetical protein